MSRFSSWLERILNWLRGQRKTAADTPKPDPIPAPQPTPQPVQPTVPDGAVWPGVAAPDFCAHGVPGEDAYRMEKLDTAKAAGSNCLKIKASYGMSNELAIHLLKYESEVEPGKFLTTDGWFFRAQRNWGVTRWVHELGTPSGADWERWAWLVKAYTPQELLFTASAATAADVVAKIRATGKTLVLT